MGMKTADHHNESKRPLRRLTPLMGATVLTTLSLVACTGAGPASESPSSSSSPSSPVSSSSTSPTHDGTAYIEATDESPARNVPAPETPDAVEAPGTDGARAALDHWWTTHRYLELTGKGRHLDEASGSGCASCVQTRRFWEDLYATGHWSTGSDRHPAKVEVELSPQKTDATLSFVMEQQEFAIWTPEGKSLNPMFRSVAEHHDWRAQARYTEQRRWIIYDIWMLYGEREDGGPDKEPEPEEPDASEPEET